MFTDNAQLIDNFDNIYAMFIDVQGGLYPDTFIGHFLIHDFKKNTDKPQTAAFAMYNGKTCIGYECFSIYRYGRIDNTISFSVSGIIASSNLLRFFKSNNSTFVILNIEFVQAFMPGPRLIIRINVH